MSNGTNKFPRQEFQFTTTAVDGRRLKFRMVDRINIDDIILHMMHRKLHELVTGADNGVDVPRLFRDSLVKERFTAR